MLFFPAPDKPVLIEICAPTPGVLRKRVFEGKRAAQAITRQFEIGIAKREPVQRKRGKGVAIEQLVRDKTAGEHITFEIQRRLMPRLWRGALDSP